MMRPLLLLLILCGGILPLLAGDPSEQFLTAYQTFQQGEKSERGGNNADALKKYRFAESLLLEISKNDPSWQKAVVEYRLKKTRDGLDRLQGNSPDTGTMAATDQGQGVPAESGTGEAPSARGPSITIVPPSSSSGREGKPVTDSSADVRRLRRQIDDLKGQLTQTQDALKSQKNRSKDLENAEWVTMRSKLENELDVANRTISDLKRDLRVRSSWEKDLKDLQKKLDDAVADKLATEEQFAEREKKQAVASTLLSQQLQEARQKVSEGADTRRKYEQLSSEVEKGREAMDQLKAKYEHSEQVAKEVSDKNKELQKQITNTAEQLAAAQKQTEELAPLRDKIKSIQEKSERLQEEVKRANQKVVVLEKASQQLQKDTVLRESAMRADYQALEEDRQRLSAKLDQASKSIVDLGKQAADMAPLNKEMEQLKGRISENETTIEQSRKKVAEAEKSAAAERSESERKVLAAKNLKDLLEQQNASLQEQLKSSLARMASLVDQGQDSSGFQDQMKKLQGQVDLNAKNYAESQRQLAELSKARPDQEKMLQDKEKSLANVQSEVEKLKTDLANSKQKISSLQTKESKGDDRLKELQEQLAGKESELARLKKRKGALPPDEKTAEENALLREIVLREVKEEAKRAQARRLMAEELSRINVQSQVLNEQITVLSAPVIQLTPQERSLFKEAQLVVAEPGEGKLQASISAPIAKEPEAKEPAAVVQGGVMSKETNQSVPPAVTNQAATNVSSSDSPWQGKFKECLARAKEEFDRQDYLQAENTFKEALKLSPDDYFALSNLGVVEFQLGKMKEAEEYLVKASDHSSDSSFALTTLGIVHYRQERLADAEKVLRKAAAINPQDFTAHNYLGIVLAASGKGKAGESEIMKAIEINPQYADAHFNLAVIYATGKPPAKMMAKKHYGKAIELGAPPDASLERLIQ